MGKQKGAMFVITILTALIAISVFAPDSANAATSIASVSLTPTSVEGGTSSNGKVVLSGAAPWSGILVSLTSSDPSVSSVPSSVKVKFFQKSANFTVTTNPVSVLKDVIISASYGGSTKTATLRVNPTIAPPVITAHPMNKTVTEGQTATFTVTATGSGLFYQWQRSNNGGSTWTNVGTNNPSYTTAATVISDNGAQFHCVVTNSAGNPTSNAATMTVNPAPPVITVHPVNKTVTVGQTATFTVTATGSGLSYQWQRSNNGGSTWTNVGTNSASYTTAATVTSDNGAQFHCVVTNSAGSATSNAATLTVNPAASTITVNDFANYRVFQRDIGGTSKSVTISGTYSNMNWSRIEARVLRHSTSTEVVSWTTIDSTPGGGTFSGNLTVPQGGWYNVEIRALDGAGSVIASSRGAKKWGVGMIILCIGQSNMSGHGQPPFTIATSDLAVNYSNAGIWEHLSDPYDDGSPAGAVDNDNSTAAGSMIPSLANSLLQTFNFPIAFVPSAKDNSNLYFQWAYRNPSNHFDTTTLYGQSITKARNVGGVELIVMHQGEADTNAHRTEIQYEADFTTLISNYSEDLYPTIPIFICQLGPIALGFNTRTDADVVAVRNAQNNLDNGEDIFMAATAMDQPRLDHVHYTVQGLDAIGERIAQTIKYYFGKASYYRGPAITTAFFVGRKPRRRGCSDRSLGWRRYNARLRYYGILAAQQWIAGEHHLGCPHKRRRDPIDA